MNVTPLEEAEGKSITSVHMISYLNPDGSFSLREGMIELSFQGGSVIRFDSGGDGESLVMFNDKWVDPFEEPLTEENRRFIETSGKWTAFDVSDAHPFKSLIGDCICGYSLLAMGEKTVGVELVTRTALIRAEVDADELYVEINVNDRDQGRVGSHEAFPD